MGFTFYKGKNFEETPIGKIPKDWKVVKVEKVCTVVGGGTPSTNVKEYWNGKIPFVTPTDVTKLEDMNVNLLSKTENYITEEGLRNSSANLLPPGSVLLTSRATIGYCVTNEVPVATNQGFASLICKEKTHNLYILYLMRFIRRRLEQLAAGSTFKEIARTIVRNLRIPLPPLHEQKKIAEILSTVDTTIQKTNEVIAKTERLKKGLMQELLTKGIGHKEFKDTEIGRIPKEWEVVKLRSIVEGDSDIVAGPFGSNLKVCDYKPDGVPIIRLQNIERNQFIDKDIKYISPEKAEELKYHSYQPGDIVLAKLGDPIGKTCIVPSFMKAGVVVADVVRIRPSPKKAITLFVVYVLNSSVCFDQLRRETIGSTRPRVNISQVRNLKIPLSPLDEQQKIAEILSTADKKLELERNEKTRLEKIKQGLMDLLLTGKIRVKVN